MKRVVIMQPYFFPYLGYFQLLHSSDVFVFFDNVNYINKGWINRNQFMLSGSLKMFTIPLSGASQNRLINEIDILDGHWTKLFFKSLEMNYRKSLNYDQLIDPLKALIGDGMGKISDLNQRTTIWCASHLGLKNDFKVSSSDFPNVSGVGKERILGICKELSAEGYNNAIGGMDLYEKQDFLNDGIQLNFVEMGDVSLMNKYASILDLMMNHEIEQIKAEVKNYSLV
jgi:hypothetical protein